MLYCGYTIYCIILLFGKSSHISLKISHIRLSFRMVDCEIAGASSSSLASLVIWIPFLMQLSCVNLWGVECFSYPNPTISTTGKNDGMYAQFNTSELKVTIKRKYEWLDLRVVTVSSVTSVLPSSSPLKPAPESEKNI